MLILLKQLERAGYIVNLDAMGHLPTIATHIVMRQLVSLILGAHN